MRILALDPGTVNFGWAVLEVNRRRVRIVKCGKLQRAELIKELTADMRPPSTAYARHIRRLLKKSKADILVSERYSTRIRGTTGEAVNIMTGIGVSEFLKRRPEGTVSLLMSMTWKPAMTKWLGAELKTLYKLCKIEAHPVDACLIGVYWAHRFMQAHLPAIRTTTKAIINAHTVF